MRGVDLAVEGRGLVMIFVFRWGIYVGEVLGWREGGGGLLATST
jgi:hypothetical protein